MTSTTVRRRILAPDLARGFMLLLIALAHTPLYVSSLPPGADGRLRDGSVADHIAAGVLDLAVLNRSYPLFALLFGYGLVWQLKRVLREDPDEAAAARAQLRRRGRWLLLLGLAMALLVTPIEILGAYGLTALLVAGVLVRGEAATARAIRVVAPISVVLAVAGALMTMAPGAAEDQVASTAALGYGVVDLVTRVVVWLFVVLTNLIGYPIVLMVLAGGWAAHRGLLERPEEHRDLLRRVVAVGLPVSVLGGVPLLLVGVGALPASAAFVTQSLSVVTGLAGGAAYAAAFGLLGPRLREDSAWLRPLRATGQRSLTAYVTLEGAIVVLLSGTFLGLGEHVAGAGAAGLAVLAWGLAVVLATALGAAGRQGPAEALLRRVTRRRPG